jgi:hypothetical protein
MTGISLRNNTSALVPQLKRGRTGAVGLETPRSTDLQAECTGALLHLSLGAHTATALRAHPTLPGHIAALATEGIQRLFDRG